MEKSAEEGDSPVHDILKHPSGIPSNAGHVKPSMNPA